MRTDAMRIRWVLLAVVAALVIATSGYLILRPSTRATSQTAPTCRLQKPDFAPADKDSSGIQVVEQGLSRVGPFGSAKASMGVMLRNATGRVAYRTLVTLDAVDSAGQTVVDEIHHLYRTQVVPVILPGESVVVGSAAALDELTQRQGNQAASISVTIGVSQWLEPGNGNTGLGKITATVVAGSGKRDASGQGEVTYDINSANCALMAPRGVSLVFRDRSGTIVGGSLDSPPPLDTCRPGITNARTSNLTQSDIPQTADLDRTTVAIYCDFDHPRTTLSPGTPYN
jgi:hypothetical protein